ncbi:hypothetical protein [Kitasatospora sp. NPDC001225]
MRDLAAVGIRSVEVFANSPRRDERAAGAVASDSLMVRAIRAVKTPSPAWP